MFLILSVIFISCGSGYATFEGKIASVSQGKNFGEFISIKIKSADGEVKEFFNAGHQSIRYTYSHLVSHQLSGDTLEITFSDSNGQDIIKEITHHGHDH
tara:strand:- start:135 stop:431 length:297 start_codon:yes stop_codon:yes gene_type:complete